MRAFSGRQILAVVGLCAACALARAQEGRVVAVVNGRPIMREDFGQALVRCLGHQTLPGFVDRMLVEQEAVRRGITLTPEQVESGRQLQLDLRLRAVMDRSRMAPDEFLQAAQRAGLDARRQLDESLSDDALRAHLLAVEMLTQGVEPTEAQLRDYFQRTRGVRYSAAHVELASRQEAERLLSVLRNRPELWEQAVSDYSLDRLSVPYKGRLAPVAAGSELAGVLAQMQPGQMCVYGDGVRWHVLRLIRVVPMETDKYEEVRDRLRAEWLALYAQGRIDSLLAQLNKDARVVDNLRGDETERRLLGLDVAAFVNGQPLTVTHMAEALIQEFGAAMLGPYIERTLVFQEAERRGLSLSPDELEARLCELAGQLVAARGAAGGVSAPTGADRAALLAVAGVDVDDVRATLLAEKLVAGDVQVTDAEVLAAYRDAYGERIQVREMAVDSAAEAERLLGKLDRGADFDVLARTEATRPGSWLQGAATLEVTPSHPYYSRISGLREGDYSGAFKYDGQYRIIKVLKKQSAVEPPPPLESVRGQLERELFLRKAHRRAAALVVKLRAEAQIEIFLRRHQ